MTQTPTDPVLKWFKGKSLENVQAALKLLAESEAQGYWVPSASRKVRAALNKSPVARKLVKEIGFLQKLHNDGEGLGHLWFLVHSIEFGNLSAKGLLAVNLEKAEKTLKTDQDRAAFGRAMEYVRDFVPVAELMKTLDDTRPKPVFTLLGVSPTITQTLVEMGVKLDPGTVRLPKIVHTRVRVVVKGKQVWTWVALLTWPEGTIHGTSRFAGPRFTHCHACGHAIKNGFNWVPVLMDDQNGVPHSLWVGRDCAESVFGIKLVGDLELADLRQTVTVPAS